MTICKDIVIHSLWECRVVNEFIAQIFNFLNTNSGTNLDIDRSRDDYIFGFSGSRYQALNLILLELKIFNFYNLHENLNMTNEACQTLFLGRVKRLIVKEKFISISNNLYKKFERKWANFTGIYDFRGPDVDIVQ